MTQILIFLTGAIGGYITSTVLNKRENAIKDRIAKQIVLHRSMYTNYNEYKNKLN
jgi:hypothetical protein